MKSIALIIMVAVLLEGLVEYAKTIMKMVDEQEYKTAITQGVTIVIGILFAFIFHLHLFNSSLAEVYEGLQIHGTVDMILTGIIISRGSNYASDFIGKLTRKKIDEVEELPHIGFIDTDEYEEGDDWSDEDED